MVSPSRKTSSAVRTVGPEVASAHPQHAEKTIHDRLCARRNNQPREHALQPPLGGDGRLPVKSIPAVGLLGHGAGQNDLVEAEEFIRASPQNARPSTS